MSRFSDSTLWRFFKTWVVAFVAGSGLIAGVVALTPVRITLALSLLVLLVCAVVAAAVAYIRIRSLHLPVEDVLSYCPSEVNKATVCCPHSLALARDANHLASKFYGRETIPFESYRRWLDKNPDILVCLLGPAGELLGYFDLLPLRKEILRLFAEGKLREEDIDDSDILSPNSARRCKHLYFSGIAVRNPESLAGKRNASILVWAFVRYLVHFYPLSTSRQLYALASTPQGEALLRRFGFRIISPASARKDQHNFYALDANTASLAAATSAMRTWNGYCTIGWERQQTRGERRSTRDKVKF